MYVFYVSYDVCPNRLIVLVARATKRVYVRKNIKNLLIKRMVDEADTLHNVYDISLYINCVLFRSDKNSGCYGNL